MAASVILWWGLDVRIVGAGGTRALTLGEREDPVAGILALADDGALLGGSVRIVYHPPGLEVRELACRDFGRKGLRRALGAEHPSLRAPGALWCCESVRSGALGPGTLLYVDRNSLLPLLVGGLAARGVRTEGAWPLQTVVESTPPCDRAAAFLGFVATGSRALVSCVNTDGDRFVRFHEGPGFADDAVGEIGTALALLESGGAVPTLCAVDEGPAADAVRGRLGAGPPTTISLAALLERARVLQPGAPSNFLLGRGAFGRGIPSRAIAVGLGAALLAGSAWSFWATWRDREMLGRQAVAAGENRLRMQSELAARQSLHDRLIHLQRELDQASCPPQGHHDLLMALAHNTPGRIRLCEVTIEGGRFSIKGVCGAGTSGSDGPFSSLRRALAAEGSGWTILSAARNADGTGGGEFTIEGAFR
jgi:hypothetical protein